MPPRRYSKQDAVEEFAEEEGLGTRTLTSEVEGTSVPIHPLTGKPYSKKGMRDRGLSDRDASPFEQVRRFNRHMGGETIAETSYAYYLRPEGATISDILVVSPNGARQDIPPGTDQRVAKRRRALSTNAEYYRGRESRKGHIYIGPKLTEEGIKMLVEIMERNRGDEIDYIDEQIAEAEDAFKNEPRRDHQSLHRARITALLKRRSYLTQRLNVEEMVEELRATAKVQQLASLPPEVLNVMRSLIGEAETRMLDTLIPKKKTLTQAAAALGNVDFGDET